MNRAQRRVARRQMPPQIWAIAANYRCPDCSSETTYPVADQFGSWHIEVRHDDTCPWFNEYNRRKARP